MNSFLVVLKRETSPEAIADDFGWLLAWWDAGGERGNHGKVEIKLEFSGAVSVWPRRFLFERPWQSIPIEFWDQQTRQVNAIEGLASLIREDDEVWLRFTGLGQNKTDMRQSLMSGRAEGMFQL